MAQKKKSSSSPAKKTTSAKAQTSGRKTAQKKRTSAQKHAAQINQRWAFGLFFVALLMVLWYYKIDILGGKQWCIMI